MQIDSLFGVLKADQQFFPVESRKGFMSRVKKLALNVITLGVYGRVNERIAFKDSELAKRKLRLFSSLIYDKEYEWRSILREAEPIQVTTPNWKRELAGLKERINLTFNSSQFNPVQNWSWELNDLIEIITHVFLDLITLGFAISFEEGYQASIISSYRTALAQLKELHAKRDEHLKHIDAKITRCFEDLRVAQQAEIDQVSAQTRMEESWLKTQLFNPALSDGPIESLDNLDASFEGLQTPQAVLEKSFVDCFDTLLRLANKNPGVFHFNRSMDGATDPEISQIVYGNMALNMVNKGIITQDGGCRGYFKLQLNQDVSLKPTRIHPLISIEGNLRIQSRMITYKDHFTPNNPERLPEGIQPVEARRIWQMLSADAKRHVYRLLEERVIVDDHPELMQARRFIEGNSAEARKVKRFQKLINDMATAFRIKFEAKVFSKLWEIHANEDIEIYIKQKPPIVEMVINDTIVPWTPLMECIGKNGQGIVNKEIKKQFVDAIENYKGIYALISKETLLTPAQKAININGSGQLFSLFYFKHNMFGDHGCLFSSIITAFMQNESTWKQDNATQYLKYAIAAYLDIPENSTRFAQGIQEKHNLSVKDYKECFRGICSYRLNKDYFGDLELKLASDVLGVKIAVFIPSSDGAINTQLIENGLIIPKWQIGPCTKEILFVYAEPDRTYHALFPKIAPYKCESSKQNDIIELNRAWDI